jgi:uncharacterized membrane protein YkvA (DUF1232 family)
MARDTARASRRGRTTGGAARRLLGLLAFLPIASRAPIYARLVYALVRDERVPVERKVLLAAAAGYVLLGRDLIADDMPFVGGLDDLVVVVLAVDLFLDGVPLDVLGSKLDELEIDRGEFDEDMRRLRRLTPGSLRRTIRRAPELAGLAAESLRRTGFGPRSVPRWRQAFRQWISTEDSLG